MIFVPSLVFLFSTSIEFPWLVTGTHLVFTVSSLCFLVITSSTDPGYLPMQQPPFAKGPLGAPTFSYVTKKESSKPSPLHQKHFLVPALGRNLKLKYCETCYLLRPPRCSHCPDCDLCVERFDHHCPWLGNCIAKRNYRFFIGFLYSTSLSIVFSAAISVQYVIKVSNEIQSEKNLEASEAFIEALEQTGGTVVFLIYSVCISWFVLGLTCFHTYLVLSSQTTYEVLKKVWKAPNYNPFYLNCFLNIYNIICYKRQKRHFSFKVPATSNTEFYTISPAQEAVFRISTPKVSKLNSLKKVFDESLSAPEESEFLKNTGIFSGRPLSLQSGESIMLNRT